MKINSSGTKSKLYTFGEIVNADHLSLMKRTQMLLLVNADYLVNDTVTKLGRNYYRFKKRSLMRQTSAHMEVSCALFLTKVHTRKCHYSSECTLFH
ncbi:hypothetical protein HanRHA438_Chr01g0021131 [Helianthus annuus]|nr:hypothetical protein HanRHA438_Chr01g0021131 [Helianthus annuus]